jgi:hypothetical protein
MFSFPGGCASAPSTELDQRIVAAIDSQVDQPPAPRAARLALDDQERRRHHAAGVTASSLACVERGEEPARERRRRRLEGARHRRPDVGARRHVGLHREPVAGLVTGVIDAQLTRHHGDGFVGRDDTDLAEERSRIGRLRGGERVRG